MPSYSRNLVLINRLAANGSYLISLPFRDALIEALVIVLRECPADEQSACLAAAAARIAHERDEEEAEGYTEWPDDVP